MIKPSELYRRMDSTGIGFAGIDGAWWRPAVEPFPLPDQTARDLKSIGRALFALLDAVSALYREGPPPELEQLLAHKVPPELIRWGKSGRAISLRPDFQILRRPGGGVRLVATELEICPSAHGFAHAMQLGYGLRPDLAQGLAELAGGRLFLFAGTQHWSEFLFEQLAFCRALKAAGARGRVLYDRPLASVAAEVRAGQRWQPPMFGIPEKPPGWNDDVLGRITARGLDSFMWPNDERWPEEMGEALVFRFGYLDTFAPARREAFHRWQARGATFINPPAHFLDSKATMAALGLSSVRERLGPAHLAVLDDCIPETILLQAERLAYLAAERENWVLKFAGFDGGEQAWGGRSLQIGAAHSDASWQAVLDKYLRLPWPVVAQRAAPSVRLDIDYLNRQGLIHRLTSGRTRLRAFLWRDGRDLASVGGVHLTISGAGGGVSEGVSAVQAPVVFGRRSGKISF